MKVSLPLTKPDAEKLDDLGVILGMDDLNALVRALLFAELSGNLQGLIASRARLYQEATRCPLLAADLLREIQIHSAHCPECRSFNTPLKLEKISSSLD